MAHTAHADFETRSACDLRVAGVRRYVEHPTTGIWCLAWRLDDGPVQLWHPGEPEPEALLEHVLLRGRVVAHNAGFERAVWNTLLPQWPKLKIQQMDCTMARAQALGLPAGLDMLSQALGLKITKDREGYALMMRMCRPRAMNGDEPVWWNEADKVRRLGEYCRTDVEVECLVDEALPALSATERRVWELDQAINDRGVRLDIPLAEHAVSVVAEARRRANDRMWLITEGAVQKTTETAKVVRFLNARGIACESVAKGEVEELVLKSQVLGDPVAEEVITLRRAASKTSNDKYKAMVNSVSADGRGRGYLAYNAAATGRWAGRLIQPQNLPRVDPDRDAPDVERTLQLLGWHRSPADTVDALDMLTGNALEALSKCLRAMIVAPAGRRFYGGDFSNIEGRLNAWMAGEQWKLDAFYDYDANRGHDLYKLAYAKSFDVAPESVDKDQRQIGKVQELALGFQGSVGALHSMAANYGVKLDDDRAAEIVAAWRFANPKIVEFWWALQDAAVEATASPGTIAEAGAVKYIAANGFLFCRLPSGRVMAYSTPRLVERVTRAGRKAWSVEYDGLDQVTNRWGPQRLYGGLQCNNVVQGTARDVMVEAMFRAEAKGYPVVLTVHDELLCERATGSAAELQAIMSELPAWAQGLPLAAAAWEDVRYVK